MEEHFLKESLSADECSGFTPQPWFNPDGDCIHFQSADEAPVAERVDEVLTIYRSAVDDRPIGFQIKGVRALVQAFGCDGLQFEYETAGDELRFVAVIPLLLAAYERGPKTIQRRLAYATAFGQRLPDPAKVEIPA